MAQHNENHKHHGHSEHHHVESTHGAEKSLKVAILLTAVFFVVEVIGGLTSGSLSLLGDAGHMFRDVFALVLSLSALGIAKRLPTETKTFGFHRAEIFAALVNGILLIIISIWILLEANQRFLAPQPVESPIMFAVALVGLLVNLYVAFELHGSHDLNVESAYIHVLTDTFSSAAVVVASVLIFFTGQTLIDPALSAVIALLILFSAIGILKDSIRILFQFAPKDVNFNGVIKDMLSVKGVKGVHDMHIWSLCSHINVIDAHVYTDESSLGKIENIKAEIKRKLEKHNIKHATLEFECKECAEKSRVKHIKH